MVVPEKLGRSEPRIRFRGRLVDDDQDALFDEIVRRVVLLGYTPFLIEEDGLHVLQAWPVVASGKTGKPWVNAVLYVLTVLSVFLIGALRENVDLAKAPLDIWRGWPFAVAILALGVGLMDDAAGPWRSTRPAREASSATSEPSRVLDLAEPVGRRLDFLMQEFNREANTLSSKSIDQRTTQAAVDLKVLVEQMRAQVQNVE